MNIQEQKLQIAKELLSFRKKLGRSQDKIMHEAGITNRSTIIDIEKARSDYRIESLLKYVLSLGAFLSIDHGIYRKSTTEIVETAEKYADQNSAKYEKSGQGYRNGFIDGVAYEANRNKKE
ncbi:hypothetical protein [Reichenbachiella sp. MALMAid0571]|uniref:helix-turn-helix domain-containing protein n=1 Tax=Reichenbachiella sp. MALMAid0571 TaxID=3143939 RepID=UPI0032DF8C61